MMRRCAPFLVAALLSLPALASAAPAVRPSPEDVAALASASSPALSPNGSTLAYALATATFDPKAKPSEEDATGGWTRERQLWLLDLASETPRQLTTGKERAGSPAWSPDGHRIAFLRKQEGKMRIHVLDLRGGEPEVVKTGDLEPTSLRWSPDGGSLGFTAAQPPTAAEREARWRSGGVTEWDAEWRASQVWTVPVTGGEPHQVTRGPEHVVDWVWSPDGGRLLTLVSDSSDPYEATSRLTARLVSARDGAVLRTFPGEPRDLDHPRWSPDGRWVAFLACGEGLSMLNSLQVLAADGSGGRELSPSHDPTFATFEWAPDSKSLVAVVRERTGTRLWRLPVAGGPHEDAGFEGRVIDSDIAFTPEGRALVFLSSTDREPSDPSVFALADRATRVAARLNPEVARWALGATEIVRWTGPEGTPLEGLLTLPGGRRGGAPPLIVMPHGGPDDVTARRFSAMVQYFAARGYAVFRPNYRGGLGYGFDFYAANRGRFGEIESMDIESGVDALLAAGRVDPNALYFGGWSWGGYISAWTLTHSTRYRAHVVGASVNDVVLSYALSDINHGVASQWEYRGDPWRQLEAFDRPNPIRYVKAARAPTLILHGEDDARVPFAQSILLYRALRDLGVPVTFHAYPREDHPIVEPAHVAHRLRVWSEWYDRHRPTARGAARGQPGRSASR
jgi:dipeptidyl aminopeptidase/acylaminoacyl peptidase